MAGPDVVDDAELRQIRVGGKVGGKDGVDDVKNANSLILKLLAELGTQETVSETSLMTLKSSQMKGRVTKSKMSTDLMGLKWWEYFLREEPRYTAENRAAAFLLQIPQLSDDAEWSCLVAQLAGDGAVAGGG